MPEARVGAARVGLARAFAASLAAVFVALSLSASGSLGCFAHVCDSSCVYLDEAGVPEGGAGSCQVVPGPVGDIRMEGDTAVWESSPQSGPWLEFSPMRTFYVTYPPGFSAYPDPIGCEVASDFQNPGANAVSCGGNLAQYIQPMKNGIIAFNPNCTTVGLWLVVHGTFAAPDGGAAAATDGG